MVQKYRVNQFYTELTAIRSLITFGIEPLEGKNLFSLELLRTLGDPINSESWHCSHHHIGQEHFPIVETWWHTKPGGFMLSYLADIIPTKPTYATLLLPGVQPVVMDSEGKEIRGKGVKGNICIRFP
ncbi:MAG: AMP-binding protein [Flavobacteriales bacterium Tduv]